MYCASKHALTAINEGIRRELREMKSNVKITVSISMICMRKKMQIQKCLAALVIYDNYWS